MQQQQVPQSVQVQQQVSQAQGQQSDQAHSALPASFVVNADNGNNEAQMEETAMCAQSLGDRVTVLSSVIM